MTIFSLSGLSVFVTSLVLVIILTVYGKTKLHRIWSFFNLVLCIWGIGIFFIGKASTEAGALFTWRIAHIGGLCIAILFYHTVYLFCELNNKKLIIVAYSQLFFVQLLNLLGILFTQTHFISQFKLYYPQITNLVYPIGFMPWVIFAFLGHIKLMQYYKKVHGIKRNQTLYLLIGSLIGFLGGTSTLAPIFGINFYPIGNFTIPIYSIMVTYAILRHRLMDIDIIIKKTLVFAGLLASVFAMLVLPTLLIQEYIFRSASAGGKLMGLALSGVIIILSLRRIEDFLTDITDKYLFQKKYDYRELLRTFTSEVLTVVNLDNLVNLTVDKLTDIVKIDSSAVLLLNEEKQQFDVIASRNVTDPQVTLVRPDGIVTFLEQTHGYLLKKELIERKVYIPPSIQEIIDKLNAELIIPMVLHTDVMGILSLGKKKSDDNYSQDDLDILLPLARTLAIAVSNAKLFDELGRTQAEAAQNEKMAVIGTLSAGINHEICNPLGIARGQCEAFLLNVKDGLYDNKSPEELLTKAKEIMAKVIKETDRATAITKKLSSFARPAKGEAELVNVDKEVDDVLGLVGYELKLEKIEFEKRIEKNTPNVFVDRKQFQEVLFNLIRNAGQAIGEKGKITVMAKQDKGKVFIDIKDTGSGISENKLKELFNPFFTTKEPGKGTGLGLFIVRQIVEKNGGKIYLKETKVGEGATFTVEFPITVSRESKVRYAKT